MKDTIERAPAACEPGGIGSMEIRPAGIRSGLSEKENNTCGLELSARGLSAVSSVGCSHRWTRHHPDRPLAEHISKIQRDGLIIETPGKNALTHPNAIHICDLPQIHKPFEAAFIAVKSYDTIWAPR
ncbi:MAG: hypothetical protein CM1200mP20_06220 [Pseudomonadota bacterium]|nr:MAG: hypothetical protein CM1200mP20_06220 [Pseudomonadota bacterium]